MKLTYNKLDRNSLENYYWSYKLSKIKFDITSCLDMLEYINIHKEDKFEGIVMYISQQLHVHFNESIKLIKKLKKSDLYTQLKLFNLLEDENYKEILIEENFKEESNKNNQYIKDYRDNSVHYNDINQDEKDKFFMYASKFREHMQDLESFFTQKKELELKAQMIHLNINIIDKGVSQADYAFNIINLCMKLDDLLNEINYRLLRDFEKSDIT